MSVVIAWVMGGIVGFWVPLAGAIIYLERKDRLQKVVDAIRGV